MIYVLASLMAISFFVLVQLLLNRRIGTIYVLAPPVLAALFLGFVQFGLSFATPTSNDVMLGGYPYLASIGGAFDSIKELLIARVHETGLFSVIFVVLLAMVVASIVAIFFVAILCVVIEELGFEYRSGKFALLGMSWSAILLTPYLLVSSPTGVYKTYMLEGASISQEGVYSLNQLCAPYKSARLIRGNVECGHFNYSDLILKGSNDVDFRIDNLDTIHMRDGDFIKHGLDYKAGEVYMTVTWRTAYDEEYKVYAMIESRKSPPSGNYDEFVAEVNAEFDKLSVLLESEFPFYKPVSKGSVDPKWIQNQIVD